MPPDPAPGKDQGQGEPQDSHGGSGFSRELFRASGPGPPPFIPDLMRPGRNVEAMLHAHLGGAKPDKPDAALRAYLQQDMRLAGTEFAAPGHR